MDIEQIFTLAAGVDFISIDAVEEGTKRHFEHAETDVIITHRNARTRSKILDKEAAVLLQLFTKPSSWAEVILQHALDTKQDPQQVASDAFPLLMEMKEEGFLIPKEDGKKSVEASVLSRGEMFLHYHVKAVLQTMEDNAVYKVEDESGRPFALKVYNKRKDGTVPWACKNEKEILQSLDGLYNPKLIEEGEKANCVYLVTEWCAGVDCEVAASAYRNYTVQENIVAMIDLFIAVLKAFQHLHERGVVHGDIHPANVLLDENNAVKIIDYGFSFGKCNGERALRGGIDFYYDPQMADALLNKKASPPATEASEQYSLAVLFYRLLTGRHYLHFSFEPEKAYRQILEESPLPLALLDLNLPACFDMVFTVALAKDPLQRFASLKEFINALIECREAARWSPQFFVVGKKEPEKRFTHFLIQKYGWESRFIKEGLHLPPACSVNFGAAGIAYFFYRAACTNEDADLLALADVWANRAAAFATDYDKAFHTENMDISEATVGRRSLYHSPTGVHLVQALIASCRGDSYSLHKAVNDYLLAGGLACENLDLTLGKASLLLGSSFLLNELNTIADFNTKPFVVFTNGILKELWEQLDSYPAMKEKNPVDYFGIAHGWSGLLYATLLWCKATGQSLPSTFFLRLEELLAERIEGEEGVRWPVSNHNKGSWDGWCHGNAGYVFLWSLLYEHTKEERFLLLAEKTAQPLLRSRQEIAQLCCGLAGQAYAFLRLYRLTGKELYWKKTEQLKHRIFSNLSSPELRNNSLYKGEVGIGVLLCELARPELARMPLFE